MIFLTRIQKMFKAKTKVCTKCGKRKKVDNFRSRPDGKILIHSECRICEVVRATAWAKTIAGKASRKRVYENEKARYPGRDIERQREYRKNNPLKFRDYELRQHYGITLREWKLMF